MPDWWRSRSRAVENPTAFSQNPMKRFRTPTSRNPVLVRRRAENRTHEVRKSLLRSTKTGRYIEIQRLKRLIYILSIPILSELFSAGFSLWKTPDRKGMGKGAEWHSTQFCVLRSTRATRQGRWKPITNGRKTNTPATLILTPAGANTTSISSSRRDAITTSFRAGLSRPGCRTRKDSTRFVDTLITASPEFFKGKSPKEIQAFFQRAADFLTHRVGRENIVSAVVHMDEKTPHLHLTFVPLTKDNRLCAKEIIGNRANLTKWQDDFHACMVEQYPDLERGESASKTGRKHIPTRLFKQAVNLSKQARAIEAVLSGITPLNAGKKKEEALSMLKKVVSADGELLRATEKIQGHNQ